MSKGNNPNDNTNWSIHLRARIPASHAGHRGSNPLSTTQTDNFGCPFFLLYRRLALASWSITSTEGDVGRIYKGKPSTAIYITSAQRQPASLIYRAYVIAHYSQGGVATIISYLLLDTKCLRYVVSSLAGAKPCASNPLSTTQTDNFGCPFFFAL